MEGASLPPQGSCLHYLRSSCAAQSCKFQVFHDRGVYCASYQQWGRDALLDSKHRALRGSTMCEHEAGVMWSGNACNGTGCTNNPSGTTDLDGLKGVLHLENPALRAEGVDSSIILYKQEDGGLESQEKERRTARSTAQLKPLGSAHPPDLVKNMLN
eukprot:913363-Pelagomonas_calceolata.AAC.1